MKLPMFNNLPRFLLPFVLGIVVLAVAVFAVSRFLLPQTPKKPSGPVILKYWGLWEPKEVIEPLILEYQRTHPNVSIEYQKQTLAQYRERLAARIEAGSGPDIFRFHNSWVPALKDHLSPLPQKVMDEKTYQATFYPVATQDLKVGNSYVGIPLEIDGLGLYYNEDILREAGLDKPPATWDELRKLASQLTVREKETGKITRAGIAMGTTGNVDHWPDILALMMIQNGVDLKNPSGKFAEDVLSYYTIFARQDKVWEETLPASTLTFAAGNLALYFAPSWRALEIKQANPSLNFKIALVPQLSGGTKITWASYWVEGVSKKSQFQEEAWEFLEFLSTRESLRKLYTNASKLRLFGEPYSRQDLAQSLAGDPYLSAYVDGASTARSWYLASNTQDNGLNEGMIKYFEDAINAVNKGASPSQVLPTVVAGVNQLLERYGLVTPPTKTKTQ